MSDAVLVSIPLYGRGRAGRAPFIVSGNKPVIANRLFGSELISHLSVVRLHTRVPWRVRLQARTLDFQSRRHGFESRTRYHGVVLGWYRDAGYRRHLGALVRVRFDKPT